MTSIQGRAFLELTICDHAVLFLKVEQKVPHRLERVLDRDVGTPDDSTGVAAHEVGVRSVWVEVGESGCIRRSIRDGHAVFTDHHAPPPATAGIHDVGVNIMPSVHGISLTPQGRSDEQAARARSIRATGVAHGSSSIRAGSIVDWRRVCIALVPGREIFDVQQLTTTHAHPTRSRCPSTVATRRIGLSLERRARSSSCSGALLSILTLALASVRAGPEEQRTRSRRRLALRDVL